MDAAELLAWLASLPPRERDAAVERHLGLASMVSSSPPGEHLIGYHASGVAPVVRMLLEVPVAREDVVIDLGAGLGKVALLVRLLTGGTVRGVEIQRELVERAREGAERHGVALTCGDVRQVPLDDGTIFFLYLPFTGPVLTEVLDRLREVATRHAIVVCTLGVDLERMAPWLVPRPIDSFWLAIYDGVVPGVPPRPSHARSSVLGRDAEAIAFERPAT